jgi:hypothetical protein
MTGRELLAWTRESGLEVMVEDGDLRVRSRSSLTREQVSILKAFKEELILVFTEPHGTRYLWRRKDPHNVAGWRVLFSEQSISNVRLMLGDDFEVKQAKQ